MKEVPVPAEEVPAPAQDRRWRGRAAATESPIVVPPYSTAPNLSDWAEFDRATEEGYPLDLRNAGVTGSANVWVFIDAGGIVVETRIDTSSGHAELDQAAMRILESLTFEPAQNNGDPVGAWLSIPVTFGNQAGPKPLRNG